MVVGFVGLGIMGKPMAKNLCKAGYSLIVDEHHKENTDELIKSGAKSGSLKKIAGSTVMNAKVHMMIEDNVKPGFRIDLHIKDLNYALQCAHSVGAPVPMTAQVSEIMQYLHNNGDGNSDHSAIIHYYEKLTGTKL